VPRHEHLRYLAVHSVLGGQFREPSLRQALDPRDVHPLDDEDSDFVVQDDRFGSPVPVERPVVVERGVEDQCQRLVLLAFVLHQLLQGRLAEPMEVPDLGQRRVVGPEDVGLLIFDEGLEGEELLAALGLEDGLAGLVIILELLRYGLVFDKCHEHVPRHDQIDQTAHEKGETVDPLALLHSGGESVHADQLHRRAGPDLAFLDRLAEVLQVLPCLVVGVHRLDDVIDLERSEPARAPLEQPPQHLPISLGEVRRVGPVHLLAFAVLVELGHGHGQHAGLVGPVPLDDRLRGRTHARAARALAGRATG
jgi:hypothetical protein